METNAEKECSALGGLFQQIISELKGGAPVWEDFLGKAAKLHSQMKATVLTSAAFLDSFQKVADMATNTRGATKDIGTALTRLCLRHRSVEAKLKTFSSSVLDNLVMPLQDKLEEWKKVAYQMDKDHAKEYKRVRQEIKKKSSDTLRLQKKVRKGKGDAQKTLDTAMQDVSERYHLLEETEKQAVRRALIEERGRYCLFVACLKPVVEAELAMLHEITHLQEVLDALTKLTEDPQILPSASEQVIIDVKGSDSMWSFQTPPSSPTSLGSRKSSMCSISSLNSSSSGSTKSHSPSHHRCRSLSQQPPAGALRLSSVSSQDSGFTSQDTLFTRLPTPPPVELTNQGSDFTTASSGIANTSGAASSAFPPAPCVTATWPNLQDTLQFERAAASILKCQRPHTISSAYEHAGHSRPALTAQTFQPLGQELQQASSGTSDSADTVTSTSEESSSYEPSPEDSAAEKKKGQAGAALSCDNSPCTPTHAIPPLPERSTSKMQSHPLLPDKPNSFKGPLENSCKTKGATGSGSAFSPIYANMSDLSILEASEAFPPPPPPLHEEKRGKATYRKDLAAILTQSLFMQQQQQIRGHGYDRQLSDPGESPPAVSGYLSSKGSEEFDKGDSIQSSSFENKGINVGRNGSQSSSKPPPPVRRTSSLSMSSTPVLQTDTCRFTQQLPTSETLAGHTEFSRHKAFRDSCSDPSTVSGGWISEPESTAAVHAQLIQVLNARLNTFHQQAGPEEQEQDDLSKGQCPKVPEHAKNSVTSHQKQEKARDLSMDRGSVSDHSSSQSHQPPVQTGKKPARAHSIGSNEREAFMKTLNAKFAQNQQTAQQTQKKSFVQEASSQRYNKYATSPRNANQAASRRCSQPNITLFQLQANEAELGFIQTEDKPVTPVSAPVEEISTKKNFMDALNARLAQQQEKKSRVDRRSSLNLEHEISRSYMTNMSGQSTLPVRSHSRSHKIAQRERVDFSVDNNFTPMMSDAAARVHSWLASRGSVDVTSCRESLLGQIRQGISLRKVPSNDRSAPRF